jgi:hypothetical protein
MTYFGSSILDWVNVIGKLLFLYGVYGLGSLYIICCRHYNILKYYDIAI